MTTIRASPESTDPVPILSGVKQGCPLSAILVLHSREVQSIVLTKEHDPLPPLYPTLMPRLR